MYACAHLTLCDVEGGQAAGAVTTKERQKQVQIKPHEFIIKRRFKEIEIACKGRAHTWHVFL